MSNRSNVASANAPVASCLHSRAVGGAWLSVNVGGVDEREIVRQLREMKSVTNEKDAQQVEPPK